MITTAIDWHLIERELVDILERAGSGVMCIDGNWCVMDPSGDKVRMDLTALAKRLADRLS